MAIKLFVSPSTQDANRGPNGYVEAVHMNAIADILIPELQRHGFTVKRNRRTADFRGHVADSNAWKPDYHIALHSNATGANQPKTARGCSVYCLDPMVPSPGVSMATKLYARFTAITPTADRGILNGRHNLSEVAYTRNGVLVEIDFHDNAAGALWISTHHTEIANAYLLGILDQTGVAYIPPPTPDPDPDPDPPDPDPEDPDPQPPTTLYRVQIGQYYLQANAEALAERATAAGFTATIRTEDISNADP